MTKGYTQTYGVDFMETFSPMAQLNSVRILISVAINRQWPMYQLDIKNTFLHGDLQGSFIWFNHQDMLCQGVRI